MSRYTLDFKESSAKLAIESNQSIAQTARELGVNVNTLHGWVGQYRSKGKNNQGRSDMHEELKRLRKENNRLRQERDILKKAAAYFASETQ